MFWKSLITIPKICLVSALFTTLTPGLSHQSVHGQFAEASETDNNSCDQFAQSSILPESNKPQLNEAQRLNQEMLQLYDQGLYAETLPLAERILSIYRENLGDQTLEVATILNRLANLNWQLNRLEQAEIYFKEALKIRENILGSTHPDVALTLNNLAGIYRIQKKYSESEPLYQQALSIYEKFCGENHILSIRTLNNLAVIYMNQGRYKEVESIAEKLLAAYQELSKNRTEEMTSMVNSTRNIILNNLAGFHSAQKEYDKAIFFYNKAIENLEREQRHEHPQMAIFLNNLAFSQLAQGNIKAALASLNRGMNIEERHLSLTLAIGSEEEKLDYMDKLINTTYRSISLHLQNAPESQDAANLALTTVLRRKGRVLDVMANSIGLVRQNLNPDQQVLFDQLEARRKELAMLRFNKISNISPHRVAELESEEKQLETKLLQNSAEFRAEAQPIEIQDIQQLIPDNTALVELVLYRPFNSTSTPDQRWGDFHYAAYILTANGQVRWVDLGQAEPIHDLIDAFGRALSVRSASLGDKSPIKNDARALDEKLMQPIRQQLGENIRHILLSPDGRLNLIPFGALVDQTGQYLVENYTFTYLTSGRDLLRLQNDSSTQQPTMIVANPNFQDRGNPGSDSSTIQTRSNNLTSRDMRSSYDPLPGTKAEAQAIKNLLPNAIVLTKSQATENAIKAATSPGILHLATHGFFLDTDSELLGQENPLLRSGLALAGYNQRSSGGEDGVLTALEVASLNLQGTQLVVLSACQTGLGEIDQGKGIYGFGEGVYGLRRAFVIAGARSQLSSLWNVNDFATKELMEKYYQRLIQEVGMSEALRQTQLEMLRGQKYQHPYYWAAFIPSGDWKKIIQSESPTSQAQPL